ncbi:MAG: hypothetical protein L6V93_09245 [Clostridiales bacterium]|nr:MAG: hypothetical protein L6V93_09245 [Clostridiales bacterium]
MRFNRIITTAAAIIVNKNIIAVTITPNLLYKPARLDAYLSPTILKIKISSSPECVYIP